MNPSATMPSASTMFTITDKRWREYINEMMAGTAVEWKDVASELGISRQRVSQLFGKNATETIPIGMPRRVIEAIQRIVKRRAEAAGFKVTLYSG